MEAVVLALVLLIMIQLSFITICLLNIKKNSAELINMFKDPDGLIVKVSCTVPVVFSNTDKINFPKKAQKDFIH